MTSAKRRVVVVGAGNAALSAAIAAAQEGAEVVVLEKAGEGERGGNTYFTGGGFRFPYDGIETIRLLIPSLSEEEVARVDVGSYPAAAMRSDLARVTDGLVDDRLADRLVGESLETMEWLRDAGVDWVLMYGRQANEVEGKLVFYGGLIVEAVGGGKGLSDQEFEAVARAGVEVRYETKMTGLLQDGADIVGVRTRGPEGDAEIRTDAVVLAAGGFEANPEMRTRYLGAGWD